MRARVSDGASCANLDMEIGSNSLFSGDVIALQGPSGSGMPQGFAEEQHRFQRDEWKTRTIPLPECAIASTTTQP